MGAAQAQTFTFTSPNEVIEECRILPHIPGGNYSPKDVKTEREYCSINFYNTTKIALCPKVWSTSPGTMIADISQTGKSQREFEEQAACGSRKEQEFFVKFKQTMNEKDTSGTFSPSSLLYYHLARYFNTTVDVPVAVYRSMDKTEHMNRVSKKAALGKLGESAQNRAGWDWMYKSEENPDAYIPTRELFTPDRKQIYGVLVGGGGARYGSEINGIRSAWGLAQNQDFQNTPAFLALRSSKPLNEAIHDGVAEGRKNPRINRDLGPTVSNLQMTLWMKELSEIVLLDYIFSQQDRIGNIDFRWQQLKIDPNGKVRSYRVKSKYERPRMMIKEDMIQHTHINDNDAGGTYYVNFAKKTGMLENLRHFNAGTYGKLMALATDFNNKGEIYNYFAHNFNLDNAQLNQAATLAQEAATVLESVCKEGRLHFDLYDARAILTNQAAEQKLDCERPQ